MKLMKMIFRMLLGQNSSTMMRVRKEMIISPRSSHSPHYRVIESCVNFLFHITFHSDPFLIN